MNVEIDRMNSSSQFYQRVKIDTGNVILEGSLGTRLLMRNVSYVDDGKYICEVKKTDDDVWESACIQLGLQGTCIQVVSYWYTLVQ